MAKMTIEVYQCEICKGAILGSMVGFGDGSGDSFVHLHCWVAFQQGLHPTGGSLPPSEHWTTPEGMPTPKVNLVPPTSG